MLRVLFWTCFAAAMAIYITMIRWSLPAITETAGGLAPFDMRPLGYTLADARAILAAIDPETIKFYRNVQLTLDLFYPALITISLFLGSYLMLPARFGSWRWAIAALPLPIAPFDYLENNLIGEMLASGPEKTRHSDPERATRSLLGFPARPRWTAYLTLDQGERSEDPKWPRAARARERSAEIEAKLEEKDLKSRIHRKGQEDLRMPHTDRLRLPDETHEG